jgi:hypothetical protein
VRARARSRRGAQCLDMGGSEDYCRAPRERLRECEARRGYS